MSVMRDKVINLAQRQVGYKEEYINCTKYSRYFDVEAWQWFNTKKNGNPAKKIAGTAWCAIFICWLFCQNEIIGKTKARLFLGCPAPKDNCAAGVPYLWQYLKARKWQVDKKSGLPGDIIFFNSKCSHVGIIEKVDANKYYTIEGNKSNQVKRCSYSRGSSTIYGLMRPNWSEIEPKEEPKPEIPAPVVVEPVKPAPAPTTQKYKVKTNGGSLALRCAPHAKSANIIWIPNKKEITVSTFVKGDKVYGNDQWARATYNGKTGYCSAYWIKKA